MHKPFSQACENNRQPILEVLRQHLGAARRVLEIGAGTGQHAVYFAAALPWLQWQPSDRPENLPGIRAWVREAALPNLAEPIPFDVRDEPWPDAGDAIFSANTLHIMGWPEVERFFEGAGRALAAGGLLFVYGPFNYGGGYTSPSNADFDCWLRQRDPASGIRDEEAVQRLAVVAGFEPVADHAMPANNRTLVWRRR
jgi:SAM-dependent methyltransferase